MSNQVDFQRLQMETIPGCLAESAKRDPDRLALVDNTRRMTYGELWAETKALATGLQRLGVAKGDRVAVCLPNWIEKLTSMVAEK